MTSAIPSPKRIAYIVKRYPRFSETFIVNEILAHEATGKHIEIFALNPPIDSHFQPAIGLVRAPVTYLHAEHLRAEALWSQLQQLGQKSPRLWTALAEAGRCRGAELYQAVRLAYEILDRGIDHLHAHFATSATTVTRLASLFSGVPFTFTAHAKDIFHEEVDPADLAQKIAAASGVVTVSDFNVQFLAEKFGDSAHKLRRIYNGLDLEKFEFQRPDRRPSKIVAVGRLVEKKGFDDLIEACALLRDSGIQFQCKIIGGGECQPALRRKIDQLSVGDLVQLVGSRPLSDVQQSVREAAVIAVPCVTASTGDRDGLPMVLLEAMALGTPAVATSVTGIPEVVRHEETGLLIPERRPPQLAAALQRLLDDADLRVKLATAARGFIERQFDIHRNSAQLRDFFTASHCAAAPNLSLAEVG
jgi:glycosyltransferase involved in cell wall biosynthesis